MAKLTITRVQKFVAVDAQGTRAEVLDAIIAAARSDMKLWSTMIAAGIILAKLRGMTISDIEQIIKNDVDQVIEDLQKNG